MNPLIKETAELRKINATLRAEMATKRDIVTAQIGKVVATREVARRGLVGK